MRHGWRATGLVVATVALAMTTGCSSSSPNAAAEATTSSSSDTAAAPPVLGTYGVPADPSAADPTVIAQDPPVSRAPGVDALVFITDAIWNPETDSVEVGSFVQGVVESGGTCTVTMTKDGERANATGAAEQDATTTWCGVIAISGNQLSSGVWSAVVTYESSSTHGTSELTKVTVP
jgi:hypothetical protein